MRCLVLFLVVSVAWAQGKRPAQEPATKIVELEAALKAKAEVESKLAEIEEKVVKERDGLNMKLKSVTEELNKALSVAETAIQEKATVEEKLTKFQENWEKYIATK